MKTLEEIKKLNWQDPNKHAYSYWSGCHDDEDMCIIFTPDSSGELWFVIICDGDHEELHKMTTEDIMDKLGIEI
ncbi:MAG: hypothetical protein ACP5N7_00850 [Candidatus Pacearchaeota archaeon]